MALGRSFGKICRGDAVSVVASAEGDIVPVDEVSPTAAVENKSGVVRSVGSLSMRVIMPLTTWGGNQRRKSVHTLQHSQTVVRIELTRSPFIITLTLARLPQSGSIAL
jgi:hypothetical protein